MGCCPCNVAQHECLAIWETLISRQHQAYQDSIALGIRKNKSVAFPRDVCDLARTVVKGSDRHAQEQQITYATRSSSVQKQTKRIPISGYSCKKQKDNCPGQFIYTKPGPFPTEGFELGRRSIVVGSLSLATFTTMPLSAMSLCCGKVLHRGTVQLRV